MGKSPIKLRPTGLIRASTVDEKGCGYISRTRGQPSCQHDSLEDPRPSLKTLVPVLETRRNTGPTDGMSLDFPRCKAGGGPEGPGPVTGIDRWLNERKFE